MPKQAESARPTRASSQVKEQDPLLLRVLEILAETKAQNEQILLKLDELETKIDEMQEQLEEAVFRINYPELEEN